MGYHGNGIRICGLMAATVVATAVQALEGDLAVVSAGGGLATGSRFAISGTLGQPLASGSRPGAGQRRVGNGLWAQWLRWLNTAPLAGDDAVRRRSGDGVHVRIADLLANDSDPDFDPIIFAGFEAVSGAGGTVVREGPWLIYEPPGDGSADAGDTVTYYVSDGAAASVPGTLQIVPFVPGESGGPNAVAIVSDPGPPARVLVRFQTVPQRSYRVQYSDRVEGPWADLAIRAADSLGRLVFEDPVTSETRYYRIVEAP